ncbi:ATP-binding protein [Collimonas fungivorans]|uniref:ATPase, AAA family n=1 Tax=Collimonas fungivorans (strain Ter331) TaxID=1005048 RepID=G0ABS8_COLFT|nr:ATP-binding protein [Collimonas fungivorans]AEK61884.1 ATPase, AAA family [Collimonas fungivorans Ter331]
MNPAETAAYADNQELLHELRQIGDGMIERALLLRQLADGVALDQAETDDRLAALYRQASRRQAPSGQLQQQLAQLGSALQRRWDRLVQRSAASIRSQVFLPWVHLALLFQLSQRDQELLLCAFLAELDQRYHAILQAVSSDPDAAVDAGQGFTSLASAAVMLGGTLADRIDMQQSLMSNAALRQWDLVELAGGSRLGALSGGYRLNAAIASYLLARAAPQLRLEQPLHDIDGRLELEEHLVEEAVKQQLSSFIARTAKEDGGHSSFVLHLQGPDLSLQESLCAASFRQIGMRCVRLDGKAVWQSYLNGQKNRAALATRLRLLCRDALLCNRVLVLVHCQWLSAQDGADDLLDEVCNTLFDSQRYLAALNGPARRLSDLAHQYGGHPVIPALIKSKTPDSQLRLRIWQRHLPASGFHPTEPELAQLVNSYLFTEQQTLMALKEAASRRLLNPDAESDRELLLDACREQSHREQLSVAQEVKSAYRFDDIILPAKTKGWLQEVLQYAQNRHQVIENWGFDQKNQNSKNLCVLFYGPSGTGKTMAASIIANELNLGLYKIDLANIVSKYIGETEKHLAQLFDQAEAMNIVLFFDEAESLFSKRTETKDAHDRYANLQTGYLLQRIETYPGIVILSTNLLKNMDKAFTRRFKFMIEYPFPGAEQRLQLWRNAFPAATPLDAGLDLPLLAEKAALSGGNINNIAVSAAFLAAAQQQAVTQAHLLQATEREYHKLGKVFSLNDFSWGDDD